MREIKFRAWDSLEKKMIYAGDSFRGDSDTELGLGLDGLPLELSYTEYYPSIGTTHQVELMQYTGLKDKNGVDIYDGDILEKYHEEIVPFTDEERSLIPDGTVMNMSLIYGREAYFERHAVKIPDIYQYDCFNTEEFNVVGNIYQNPELIK